MRNYLFSILLGVSTAVVAHAPLPVKAEAKVYQFVGGKKFSDFLVGAGADAPIAGLKFGEIQGDRNIALVPEPSCALAILMLGAVLAASKLRRRAA